MTDIGKIKTLYRLIYELYNYLDEECEQICRAIWFENGAHFSNKYRRSEQSYTGKNIAGFYCSLDEENKQKFKDHIKLHFSEYTNEQIMESIND